MMTGRGFDSRLLHNIVTGVSRPRYFFEKAKDFS